MSNSVDRGNQVQFCYLTEREKTLRKIAKEFRQKTVTFLQCLFFSIMTWQQQQFSQNTKKIHISMEMQRH